MAYDYIMLLFLCTRYLILLLLEIISPIAIACLYNKDTRSSFYTWVKQMLGCYMLYPGFILASVFSDLIVTNYVLQRSWSVLLMVIFSFPAQAYDARHGKGHSKQMVINYIMKLS